MLEDRGIDKEENCTWEQREQVWRLMNPWYCNMKRKTLHMAKLTEVIST